MRKYICTGFATHSPELINLTIIRMRIHYPLRKKQIILPLFMFMLIVSCAKDDKETNTPKIKIDFTEQSEEKFMTSQVFKKVSYIQLDTSCVVGQLDDIRIHGNTIYICNKYEGVIHRFEKEGKYISSIKKRGRAGNEYVLLTDFEVSPINGDVHIYDSASKRILVYSKEGYYKKNIQTDDIIRDFAVLDNGDYLMYTPDKNGNARRGLWITDSVGTFRKQLVKVDNDYEYGGIYPHYLSRIDKKHIGLMGGEDYDNFYIVSGDSVKTQLDVEFNITIPTRLKKERNIDYTMYKGEIYTKNNYFESHRWIWFTATDFNKIALCFYDKVNNNCHIITNEESLIEDIKLYGTPLYVYDDMMISVIYASDVLASPTMSKMFPNINDTSNPILELVEISK